MTKAEILAMAVDEDTFIGHASFRVLVDEVKRLRAAADAGYELSTWAATIRWGDPVADARRGSSESNTPEWLDGLRERIERVQALAKKKEGVNADG